MTNKCFEPLNRRVLMYVFPWKVTYVKLKFIELSKGDSLQTLKFNCHEKFDNSFYCKNLGIVG